MNKISYTGLTLAGLFMFGVSVNAEIYKWVDENNDTHYSQLPPPAGIESDVITGSLAPKKVDSKAAKETLEAQRKKLDELAENRRKEKEAGQKERERIDLARANCKKARAKLTNNLNTGRIRAVDEEGNVVRATEEERQRRIKDAREKVEKWCNQ